FLVNQSGRLKRGTMKLASDALDLMVTYAWPGNIRELENVIERTVLLTDGDTIRARDLPVEIQRAIAGAPPGTGVRDMADPGDDVPETTDGADGGADGASGLKEQVREATSRLEKELIVKALAQTGHNVTQAARLLQISRKSLQIKMKELGLREQG
ncbi:MAG: helix-turn-helix domain-containing protein, partial [Deltaproteobacteria bacterium]